MNRNSEFESVKRILEMVRESKVSHVEASKLLGTLNSRLASVTAESWERLLGDVASGLDTTDLATLISATGNAEPTKAISRGTAQIMRLNIVTDEGSEIRVNLPVGLATFALKLIPASALQAMREQGLDPESLTELLRGELPEGEILHIEASDGAELTLNVE